MQSKITPRPGGYNFQLVDYWTRQAPPQDVLDAVRAKIQEIETAMKTCPESWLTGYRLSLHTLRGNCPPVRA